jgi:large subunit ribosomal protein L17
MIDQYGDGTPNPDLLQKEVTVQVAPRKTVAADTRDAMPVGAIKGNADSGLYHMPNSAHYDETIAEQWFTTEAEAKAAGFIKYTGRRKKKS